MNPIINKIIGNGILSGIALSQEAKERISRSIVADYRIGRPLPIILRNVQRILDIYAPAAADIAGSSQLAAWIMATKKIVQSMPQSAVDELVVAKTALTPEKKQELDLLKKNFPLAGMAAEFLLHRSVVTSSQLATISASYRRDAYSSSDIESQEVLEKMRDNLAQHIAHGPSLSDFTSYVKNDLNQTHLSDSNIETKYRTTILTEYSDARRSWEANPVVAATFPYKAYYAHHDSRCRPEHRRLEKLGLNGTNIYRTDDPMWQLFDPPWDFNCRCTSNLLTIAAAARSGVKEAQKWLKTGIAPRNPTWRLSAISFRCTSGFERIAI